MTGQRVAAIITKLDGGAGVLALRGALAAAATGYETTIVTGSGGRLVTEARDAGVEVVLAPELTTPIRPATDLRAVRALTALLRQRRFAVVHTHTAKAGAAGRIAARRAGVPRIVHTYHGFPFHEFQSPARRGVYTAVERRLGRITDVALCVGTGIAVEAVRLGLLPPERIRTMGVAVPPGPAACPDTRKRARSALGLDPDAVVVGAVGRLVYQKAPEDFLEALRILAAATPGLAGVWIGDGELAPDVRRLAARPGMPPVVLAGDRTDVADLLPALDVFALPSRYEGLPTAIVEAMTCGIPVVATAVNAVGDVVVPGETGLLVPPRRPALLAGAIEHLLRHPAEAARMAAAARDRLGARFTMDTLRDTLASTYTAPLPARAILSRALPGDQPAPLL
jgi:glycosyltransferase involved in cell wall biosynthesis